MQEKPPVRQQVRLPGPRPVPGPVAWRGTLRVRTSAHGDARASPRAANPGPPPCGLFLIGRHDGDAGASYAERGPVESRYTGNASSTQVVTYRTVILSGAAKPLSRFGVQ